MGVMGAAPRANFTDPSLCYKGGFGLYTSNFRHVNGNDRHKLLDVMK